MHDETLGDDEKAEQIHGLTLDGCAVEDLCLTFQYSPSSAVYGYQSVELKPGGAEEAVTIHNLEEYIDRSALMSIVPGLERFYQNSKWPGQVNGHPRTIYLPSSNIEVPSWCYKCVCGRTVDWALVRGVRAQLEALRHGFNTVFPLDRLCSFTPEEVRTMLCGDQVTKTEMFML